MTKITVFVLALDLIIIKIITIAITYRRKEFFRRRLRVVSLYVVAVGDHAKLRGHQCLRDGLQRAVGQDDASGVGGRGRAYISRQRGQDACVLYECVRNYYDRISGQRQVSGHHAGGRRVVGHRRAGRGRLDHVPRVAVMRLVRLVRAQVREPDVAVLAVTVHHRRVRVVRRTRWRLHRHRRYGMHAHVPVQAHLRKYEQTF